MLPSFIIDELLRRERSEKTTEHQKQLELPLPSHPKPVHQDEFGSDDADRGVMVIPLWD